MLVLCHELPPGSLRTPKGQMGASSCQITATLESHESVLWVKSLCFYDFTGKNLLTSELIGKFQRIFPCLQEGCCVQTSQDVDGLTTEPFTWD